MYPSGRRSASARLPPNNFMNLKTVEVGRGRNGYGFTVAGQHPCVLSCIMPNSPAEFAMLKPGDCVIAVNGENVTRLNHEQFIKLIGETTGVLRLTVADMAAEDLSDEDDYYDGRYPRQSGSFPRARSSTPGMQRTQMVLEELNNGALFQGHPSRKAHYTQQMYYNGGGTNGFNSRVDDQDKFAPGHLSPYNRTDQMNAGSNARAYEDSYWNGQKLEHVNRANKPKRRQRDHRQRATPVVAQRSYYVKEDPYDEEDEEEEEIDTRPLTPYELNNIAYPSMVRTDLKKSVKAEELEETNSHMVTVVIGYLGSVDIPAAANLPTASLQAIRGCVRRLRVEQRIHSLMVMNIDPSGIRLLNASSQVTVMYPANKIVFSGICPDDKRCFGVVTVQNAAVGQTPVLDDEEPIGSACHVFIIDPELSSHQMHEEISLQFGLDCTPSLENHTCAEYPSSSRVVLHHVSQFYQDRQDNSHFGDFYGQAPYVGVSRRSNSGSSNSDSGFGNGGRDGVHANGSDQILDVASHIRNQRANRSLTAGHNPGHPGRPSNHNSHYVNFARSELTSHHQSEMSSPKANHVGRVNLEDKLTPRARPDPVQVPSSRPSHAVAPTLRSGSVNIFEMAQSSTLPTTQRDVRRLPLRHVSHDPSWENGSDVHPNSLPENFNGMDPYGSSAGHRNYVSQPTVQYQQPYLQPPYSQGMANLRRGSDCSDYSSAQQAAKRNALRRAQAKKQAFHSQNRNSLTASDGELTSIDDVLKQDGNTASQADLAEETPPEVGRVSGWAVSFERLLKDELGLRYFTDFLKQEFSEENILFWIACEKLSKVQVKSELQQKANAIYRRFLSPQATMPVNLEGDYRHMVEKAIKNPSPEMYKEQQLQIFKLMKLDSYSRFLKSKLYQDCVLSEMGNLPMPTIETQSITELTSDCQVMSPSPDMDKEKNRKKKDAKVGKNKDEDKRSSLLMTMQSQSVMDLRQIKSGTLSARTKDYYSNLYGYIFRPQSREAERPESPQRQLSEEKKNQPRIPGIQWFKGITGKRPGSQRDSSSKGTQFYITSPQPIIPTQLHVSQSDTHLIRGVQNAPRVKEMQQRSHCMVTLPNDVTIVVKTDSEKSIGEVLLPLCEEHGLTQTAAEIFIKSTKGGLVFKEKLVDFHRDISALAGQDIMIERRIVFKIELPNKRLIGVKSKPTKKLIEVLRPVTHKYELQLDDLVIHLCNSPIPLDLEISVATLDNQRIMIETLEQYSAGNVKRKGKTENGQESLRSVDSGPQSEQPITSDETLDPSKKTALEEPPAGSSEESAAPSVQENNNNPRGNLRVTGESEDLYRLVAKANRRRLDDQRGLTIRNLDLPAFLLPRAAPEDRPASSMGFTENDAERKQRNEEAKHRLTEVVGMEVTRPMSTPPRSTIPSTVQGFTSGRLPSHEEADAVFGGLHGMENVSFGESLGSSGYPDSLGNTTRSFGDGAVHEHYDIPEFSQPDSYLPRDETVAGFDPKTPGMSINSEMYEPSSPGFDLDVTLTSPTTAEVTLPLPPTPGPDVTLQVGLAEYPPPTPLVSSDDRGHQLSDSKMPSYRNSNNNHLKTLYEESSTETNRPKAKPRPQVAPKPAARRTTSLPSDVKLPPSPKKAMMTVVGTDGRMHRATFV
ncbi:regulator of G-protein signaling 12-like isoform X4 [Apostichopus japonicus]